jgi:hypothetical protein
MMLQLVIRLENRMGAKDGPKGKKILPNAAKGQSFKAASEATNKQYAWTLAKLAGMEPSTPADAAQPKPQPKILPRPGKGRESLQESLKSINEKYGWTLRKLAEFEEAERKKK